MGSPLRFLGNQPKCVLTLKESQESSPWTDRCPSWLLGSTYSSSPSLSSFLDVCRNRWYWRKAHQVLMTSIHLCHCVYLWAHSEEPELGKAFHSTYHMWRAYVTIYGDIKEETVMFLVWGLWVLTEWVSWISEMLSSIWDVYVFCSTMVLFCFLYFD